MANTLKVRPAAGEFPLESSNGRRRFSGPREVPNTEFYRRAIVRGDLVEVESVEAQEPAHVPTVAPVEGAALGPVLLERASRARRAATKKAG